MHFSITRISFALLIHPMHIPALRQCISTSTVSFLSPIIPCAFLLTVSAFLDQQSLICIAGLIKFWVLVMSRAGFYTLVGWTGNLSERFTCYIVIIEACSYPYRAVFGDI